MHLTAIKFPSIFMYQSLLSLTLLSLKQCNFPFVLSYSGLLSSTCLILTGVINIHYAYEYPLESLGC